MSKLKSKESFKERDEIEEYFSEVKNKSFPVGIIFLIIFLLILSGCAYYYFIIDSPQNIFLTIINNNLKIDNSNAKKLNYDLSLDTNIITTNKDYIDEINIIKEIALTAKGGIDLTTNENITKLNTFYKGEKLLDIDIYSNNNLYLKSSELFNKVIKINNQQESETKTNYHIEIDNLKKLTNSLKDEIKILLNKATYQKEYTKLDNNLVKKVTLLIDNILLEELYNNLLDNNDFVESYSKLTGVSQSTIKEEIKNKINSINNETKTITLYLSIFKNDLFMFEIINNEERITITKENNTYTYKIYDKSIIIYQGYLEILKTNNNYKISLSFDDIEEELNIILNLDLSLEYDKKIEFIDITNFIDYNDLTEKDKNIILDNISKNKILKSLFEDINSLSTTNDLDDTEKELLTA